MTGLVDSLIDRLRARGIALSRLQAMHPTIDRAVKTARRVLYTREFFRDGPRRRGRPGGTTFVVLNHTYDLDVDALCAADTAHEVWVLDPFSLFTDVFHFFPPGQRDLDCVYGEGAMRGSIARFKAAYVSALAHRLVRETRLHALITPSDTFYYVRPLIEELAALGVPTVVQDKEGTIAPGPIMAEHARMLATRYPPIADAYYFWNDNAREYWRGIGVGDERAAVLGQPRSDFFFHPQRWLPKAELGLTDGKRLVVAFTFDADAYLRTTEPLADRPWKPLRDDMHDAVHALASERDDVEVVIKAHPQQADVVEIAAEIAARPRPNVQLMTGARIASHLLVHADAILGFQSTVMIEAMLLAKPVIYVGRGELHDRVSDALVPIHTSGGCAIPRSRAELDRALRDALAGKLAPSMETMRARKAFTDRYFWNADGRAAERVLAAAAELVGRRGRSRAWQKA